METASELDVATLPYVAVNADVAPPPQGSSAATALLVALSVYLVRMMVIFYAEKDQFLFKDVLGLNASQVGTLGIILGIPGYLRPFMGAWSDLFPFLGYHRKSYYTVSWLILACGFGGLAVLSQYLYATVACLLIVAYAGQNLLFVVMDAVMVEVGNRTGTIGRLQTIQQGLQLAIGATFAGLLGGYVTAHWSYTACYATAAGIALLGLPLSLLIVEPRVARSAAAQQTAAVREKLREERKRSIAALKKAAGSLPLWAVVGYVFYLILTPGTNTAEFFYKVDGLHFTKQVIGNLNQTGNVGAVFGILLFAAGARRIPVRAIVWGAYLGDCLGYVINLNLHDLPSAYATSFIGGFSGILYTLCVLTLAARACPPGLEGTVYGLVIAAQALAGTLGEKIGASIYDWQGPASHFTIAHGWYALNVVGLLFTIVAVVFIPFLPAWTRSREPLRPTAEPVA